MLLSGLAEKSICFEISEVGKLAIKENWHVNGSVGDIQIEGEANCRTLNKLQKESFSNCLVLIDIEGFEFELLQLDTIEQLRSCDVIIEIHNWVDDFEIKYINLLNDLSKFFEIQILQNVDRKTCNIEELRSYTDDNRLLLTSERRPCLMRFLKLTPLK